MADAARLLEEALSLDPDERAKFAHRLIQSLEPGVPIEMRVVA
jgi:hypothetical protein